MDKTCDQCREAFQGRTDARYCSAKCRKAASRGVKPVEEWDRRLLKPSKDVMKPYRPEWLDEPAIGQEGVKVD